MVRLFLVVATAIVFALGACGNTQNDDVAAPAAPDEDVPGGGLMAEVDSVTIATHARLMEIAREQDLAERPIGEVVQLFAEELLGYPYVEHMLDQQDEETLVISLAGFDCVLFNEAVLALAQAVRARDYDFETFARNVESFRYRGGTMVDYCSRLHYYSDWLRDNDRRGNVRLITPDLRAAEPFVKIVNFMTEHREAYRGLRDDEMLACVADVQDDLNTESFMYVPQARITEVYDQLQAGDMLAMTTTVDGLDIAHTGFVYRHDGGVGMIHASTVGEVRIDRDLATYVRNVRIQNGIMVARPQDSPRER